jgi:hypothetical protein
MAEWLRHRGNCFTNHRRKKYKLPDRVQEVPALYVPPVE